MVPWPIVVLFRIVVLFVNPIRMIDGFLPISLLFILITEQLSPTGPLAFILRVRDAVMLLAQVAWAAKGRLAYSFNA